MILCSCRKIKSASQRSLLRAIAIAIGLAISIAIGLAITIATYFLNSWEKHDTDYGAILQTVACTRVGATCA